jgi:hypothetical protein
LIDVNWRSAPRDKFRVATLQEAAMPAETVIMLTLVVAIFATFMGVIAWAERSTRSLPRR